MASETEQLRLLAIFHFVVAGIAGLFALFPILHLALGLALVSGVLPDTEAEPGATLVGWFFVLFASTWILCGLAFAVCMAVAGRNLMARRRYTFCLVMAGVACAFVPFGTVLGVFTIILLMKDSVKAMFEPGPQTAG